MSMEINNSIHKVKTLCVILHLALMLYFTDWRFVTVYSGLSVSGTALYRPCNCLLFIGLGTRILSVSCN